MHWQSEFQLHNSSEKQGKHLHHILEDTNMMGDSQGDKMKDEGGHKGQ